MTVTAAELKIEQLKSADGLPDLKPVLARFVQRVTPDSILDALPVARTQVLQAVINGTERTSRPVP